MVCRLFPPTNINIYLIKLCTHFEAKIYETLASNSLVFFFSKRRKKFTDIVLHLFILRNLKRCIETADCYVAQCGIFMIFLSPRFYVKSIFENLEVLKLPLFAILGAQNFDDLLYFSLQKVQNFIKIKIQCP